jgi:peptidoglycan/LPS O-acetylase OafA/YrhL
MPSLDGLRAISIGLVFLGHLQRTAGFGVFPPWAQVDFGNIGVRVFFVISGYLITTLLLRELQKSGTISISQFYVRRAFRIFPAFYTYIAVVAIFARLGIVTLRPGDILCAATYTTNYHYDRAWALGHTWSLAVEEQFYLAWPLLLRLLGKRRGLVAALTVIALAPIVRVATLHLHFSAEAGIGESFQTVSDAIAAGCVLACVLPQLEASPLYTNFQRSKAFVVVPLAALSAALVSQHGSTTLSLAFGETCLNVSIALIIHYAIRYPEGLVGRVLNARALAYVGTLSYSLYLWQQPFLDHRSTRWFAAFPVNVALATVCALASFYVVEQPFLRWRDARAVRSKAARAAGAVNEPTP